MDTHWVETKAAPREAETAVPKADSRAAWWDISKAASREDQKAA